MTYCPEDGSEMPRINGLDVALPSHTLQAGENDYNPVYRCPRCEHIWTYIGDALAGPSYVCVS